MEQESNLPTNIDKNIINMENLPKVHSDTTIIPQEYMDGRNDVSAFLQIFEQYMTSTKKSSGTINSYLPQVKRFLVWCNEANLAVNSIKTTLALRNLAICWEKAIANTDWSQNSKAQSQKAVKCFFKCYDFFHGEYNLNISKSFSSEWVSTADNNAYRRVTRINDEVFEAIREQAFMGDINDKWIFFFFAFGCRRSEICQIEVKNLDFLNKEINIYQQKQGTNKKIPMPDWANSEMIDKSARYLIYNQKTMGGQVIKQKRKKGEPKPPEMRSPINGDPVSPNYIYSKLIKWRDSTKFKHIDISPHSMRRYFVTNLLKQGASDSNIARLGGWSNTSQIYKYGYDVTLENNPIVSNKLVKY